MIHVLLITPDRRNFAALSTTLEAEKASLLWEAAGVTALEALRESPVDLVIADAALDDMTGLEFAERLVALNPMINCALVSPLEKEAFHEASEGLGIAMQLPPVPDPDDAKRLVAHLKQIMGYTRMTDPRSTAGPGESQ